MARHVCGTCRFYRATAPNAKTGWCGHPLNQTTTDVRILVRAGELNCRNDWDRDLWQLREVGDHVLDVTMLKAADPGDASGRPSQPRSRRTLGEDRIKAERLTQPVQPGEDVVIDADEDGPRLVSEDLNRELLRRAREQYRARKQTARPGGPRPRVVEDAAHREPQRREPIVISNDVQPLPIGEPLPRDLTRVSDRRMTPDDGDERADAPSAFTSVPDVEERVALPRRAAERSGTIPTVDDYEMESIRSYDEIVESRRGGDRPPRATARFDDAGAALAPPPERRRTEPPDELLEDVEAAPPLVERPPENRSNASGAGPDAQSETRADLDLDDMRPWDYVEPRRPRAADIEPREAVRTVTSSSSRLWDEIPRCCRTCRDFRPADSGGRGWCTNRWAFRHRRMVDIDELPCETTIGAWWLPTDDVWQDDQDVGRHLQATPLMDRWFGRADEEIDDFAAVASRARRRR